MFATFVVLTTMLVTIAIHELAHLLSALFLGMSVSKYAVGFGPKLFGFRRSCRGQKGEIEWSVHALPFGGFVRIHGMFQGMQDMERKALIAEGRTEEECSALLEPSRLYCNRPGWEQAIVISAGVVVNLLCAITTLVLTLWMLAPPSPVQVKEEQSVNVVAGEEQTVQPISLWEATVEACSRVKETSVDMLVAIQKPIVNLRSPVHAVQETDKVVKRKVHPGFIWVMSFVSLNITAAVLNLLPIPGLDGGHLVCAIFKAVVGVPVPVALQMVSSAVCILLLSGLMVFLLVRDVVSLVSAL